MQATVEKLAAETGRRIILTTTDRQPIVDSANRSDPTVATAATAASTLQQPAAIINPLKVDPYLAGESGSNRIDPRALGPYRISAKEKARLKKALAETKDCLGDYKPTIEPLNITYLPNGRPVISLGSVGDPYFAIKANLSLEYCSRAMAPGPAEKAALSQLNRLIKTCLKADGLKPVRVNSAFSPVEDSSESPKVRSCIDASRREQLAKYVAPPALFFVGTLDTSTGSGFELSRANTVRIAGVATLVLFLTVLVTVVVGTRLVRPLRALADAVRQPTGEQILVPVSRTDEIGYLASAFNDLSERRQEAENQRKAMVSDIAHELRTPLNNIRGWLEAAEDGVAKFDRSLSSSLLEEAMLLQHVIDDLQDLAEAEAGQLEMHLESVIIADLLEQVASAQRARSEAADVMLATHVDGDLRTMVDPVRFRQAIGNLVSNAIRHSPPGETVTLRARLAGERLLIEVGDNGSGIGPDELPHVFDRFWRAEKSRSRQTGGSGLGLAIVRQLVQAHGGEVSVISNPGLETVFTVRLPNHTPSDHAVSSA